MSKPDRLRLISKAHLSTITGLSRSTIDRERRAKRFPPPLEISPGRIAWDIDDIERWKAERRHRG